MRPPSKDGSVILRMKKDSKRKLHAYTKVVEESKRQKVIQSVICPQCNTGTKADRCKQWDVNSFSNLRCRACGEITSAREWRCRCSVLWYKCMHHKPACKKRAKSSHKKIDEQIKRRKAMVLKFGTVKPKPRLRLPRGTATREETSHVYIHDGSDRHVVPHYSERTDQRVSFGVSAACMLSPPLHCV